MGEDINEVLKSETNFLYQRWPLSSTGTVESSLFSREVTLNILILIN